MSDKKIIIKFSEVIKINSDLREESFNVHVLEKVREALSVITAKDVLVSNVADEQTIELTIDNKKRDI